MRTKPKTAGDARIIKGEKRPMTSATGPLNAFRPFTGVIPNGLGGLKSMARGMSANYASLNPKLRRFESLIYKLKKILESEKKSLR